MISTYRESSRVVFIPFLRPDLASGLAIDDTRLLTVLKLSGDALSLFISLGKRFETIRLVFTTEDGVPTEVRIRGDVDKKLSDLFSSPSLSWYASIY